jgi:flagellar assembly protein FliH
LSSRIYRAGEAKRPEANLGNSIFKSVAEVPVAPKPKTKQSQELERQAALEAGFVEGQSAGFTAGYEAGRIEGHAEGFVAGEAEARAAFSIALNEELAQFVAALQSVSDQLPFAIERWYRDAENQLSAIATEIVSRVLKAELRSEPESVLALVKTAVAEVTPAKSVKIRLNPGDAIYIARNREAIERACQGLKAIEIVDDPSISGGCIVESDHGLVDATIESTIGLLEDHAA